LRPLKFFPRCPASKYLTLNSDPVNLTVIGKADV
jgi:hypothetical protein